MSEDFMNALLGSKGLPGGLVIPLGWPVHDGKWGSVGWRGGPVPERATHYAPVLVRGEQGAWASRVESNVVSVWGIVADDVGVKGRRLWGAQPWAEIETSPGSCQVLWVFSNLVGFVEARDLNRVMVEGGFTDREGAAPARFARLPGSLPAGKVHRAALADWPKASIHSLDLALEMAALMTPEQIAGCRVGPVGNGMFGDIARVVREGSDQMLGWLARTGQVRGTHLIDGWVKVVCPNNAAHCRNKPAATEDERLGGTSYRAGEDYTGRGFLCRHSSCRDTFWKANAMMAWKKAGAPVGKSEGYLQTVINLNAMEQMVRANKAPVSLSGDALAVRMREGRK